MGNRGLGLSGCEAVVRRLLQGSLPELILATTPQPGPLVAIEGNGRLTSFALFPDHLPEVVEVFCAIAQGHER